MALIAIASAKGAPGCTTSAIALTRAWPRPVLLVEADIAGSSILPGFYAGALPHDRGLRQLAVAYSHGELSQHELRENTLPMFEGADDRYFLPGIPEGRSAPALRDLWGPLTSLLATLESGGVDVILDLGRLHSPTDPRESILTVADLVLITTGSRLPDIFATRALIDARVEVAARQVTNHALLVVGPGRPYPEAEIAKTIGLASVGSLAWDPVSAEVYSVGAKTTSRFDRSHLTRTASTVAHEASQRIARRRTDLGSGE